MFHQGLCCGHLPTLLHPNITPLRTHASTASFSNHRAHAKAAFGTLEAGPWAGAQGCISGFFESRRNDCSLRQKDDCKFAAGISAMCAGHGIWEMSRFSYSSACSAWS